MPLTPQKLLPPARTGHHLRPGARRRRAVGMTGAATGLAGVVGLSLVCGNALAQPSSAKASGSGSAQAHAGRTVEFTDDATGADGTSSAAGAPTAQTAQVASYAADSAEPGRVKLAGSGAVLAQLDTAVKQSQPVVVKSALTPVPTLATVADRASRRPSKANSQGYARMAVSARGWGKADFQCLVKLWTKESQWEHTATNPSSGAYGIPQALPGGKMASAGKNWRTDPPTQVRWGLTYIKSRYGTPCAAWRHSQATNWY